MSSRTGPGTLRGVFGADPGLRGTGATAGRMPPADRMPPAGRTPRGPDPTAGRMPPAGPLSGPPRARPDPGHARAAALAPARRASRVTARGTPPPWVRHRLGYVAAVGTPPPWERHRIGCAWRFPVASPVPYRRRCSAYAAERTPPCVNAAGLARTPLPCPRGCRVGHCPVLAVWAEHVGPCRVGHRHTCSTALCSNALCSTATCSPAGRLAVRARAPPRSMRPPQSVRWPESTAVSPVR